MKMVETPSGGVAVMENVGGTGKFSIKASAKSFQILSDGLYSNKIRAIVRELSTNAIDSHIEAKRTEVPIETHLPTALEPWFSVRDQGIGLDQEGVMSLYTTYFESTKNNSDDYIGALGLGSKSPFSYTDNFTVIAIKDGRKGIYTAYINESGFPSIVQMQEESTEEHNGLEVRFAVKESDFDNFYREARIVYAYFDTEKVNVTGVSDFTALKPVYKEENIVPGVNLRNSNSYHGLDQMNSKVIMGHIAYPIYLDYIHASLSKEETAVLQELALDIFANIGDVDIQPSREGLGYTDRTVTFIKDKLQSVFQTIFSSVQSELDGVTNAWDYSQIARAIARKSTIHQQALASYNVSRQKNGTYPDFGCQNKYSSYRYAGNQDVSMVPNVFMLSEKHAELYNVRIQGFQRGWNSSALSQKRTVSNIKSAWTSVGDRYEVSLVEGTYFVVQNSKSAVMRTKEHFRDRDYSQAWLIRPIDKDKPFRATEFLRDHILEPRTVYYTSELDPLESQTKKENRTVYDSILKLNDGKRHNNKVFRKLKDSYRNFDVSVFDGDQKIKFYVPMSGNILSDGTIFNDVNQIPRLCNIVRDKYKLPSLDIYGVRKPAMDFVKSRKDWVNLEEALIEAAKEIPDTAYIPESDIWSSMKVLISVYEPTSFVDGIFKDFCEKYKTAGKTETTYAVPALAFLERNEIIDISAIRRKKEQFIKDAKELTTVYPMLKYVMKFQYSGSSKLRKDIAEYINMVSNAQAGKE